MVVVATVVLTSFPPSAFALDGGDVAPASVSAVGRPAATCRGLVATIHGTPGDDVLVGTEGPDVIVGMAGDDTITGGGGDDVICAGAGADTVSGGDGNDVIRGGAPGADGVSSDLIIEGPGDDLIRGKYLTPRPTVSYSESATPITGRARLKKRWYHVRVIGADTGTDKLVITQALIGTAFDDSFRRVAYVDGGAGDDMIRQTAYARGGAGNDLLTARDGSWLYGGPGDDVIRLNRDGQMYGGGYGEEGNDVIRNAASADGGPGDDTIIRTMQVRPGPGNDFVRCHRCAVDYSLDSSGVKINMRKHEADGATAGHDELHGIFAATGSPYADTFIGVAEVTGGAGDDTVRRASRAELGDGDDVGSVRSTTRYPNAMLWGQAGNDVLVARGLFQISGDEGDDTIHAVRPVVGVSVSFGGPGNDTMFGDDSDDVMYGEDGDDHLYGGGGDDYLGGADGYDTADGGAGVDTCRDVEESVNCELDSPLSASLRTGWPLASVALAETPTWRP